MASLLRGVKDRRMASAAISFRAAAFRERRVVDVQSSSSSSMRRGAPDAREQASPGPRDHRTADPRDRSRRRRGAAAGSPPGPSAAATLRPISAPNCGVLLGRGPHQRHRRVVLVELAPAELLGNRLRRAEVDHVGAPTETTCGNALPAGGGQASGPAVRMPPTSSSASSVVVMSRTPAISPSAISDSIACPPLPVA